MARLLLLSNGHGEDFSGALLGIQLSKIGHKVDAFPLVGAGKFYTQLGIKIIGKTQEFSTGGIGYTSLMGRLTELLEGQLMYLLSRLLRLLFLSRNYDMLVVIGDVVPVTLAWLTGRPVVTYLVAYSSHYEGKLRLPWPCSMCLRSRHFLGIYSRDKFTANDLTFQLRRQVDFLGNPFMDPVFEPKSTFFKDHNYLGILPGSRRPELDRNLLLILSWIEFIPINIINQFNINFNIALVGSLDDNKLIDLIALSGWAVKKNNSKTSSLELIKNSYKVNIHRNSFVQILQSSTLLLAMAGTAAEQAIGLGKPVLQMVGNGPQFTPTFAEAQRRLLGPTIFCADGLVGDKTYFHNTTRILLELLERINNDPSFNQLCLDQAEERLGSSGGSYRLANAINQFIIHELKG